MYGKKIIFGLLLFLSLGMPLVPMDARHLSESADGDEVYLSFRFRGLGNVIITAWYDYNSNEILLPVSELFGLLYINHEVDLSTQSVRGFFLRDSDRYEINFANLTARKGSRTVAFTADDIHLSELDFFLHPRIFEELFDMEFVVDLSYLSVILNSLHTMPITERFERMRLRQRLEEYTAQRTFHPLMFDRERRVMGGFFLDYSLTASGTFENQIYLLSGNLGAEFLGGDVQGTFSGSMGNTDSNYRINNLRWRYVFNENPYINRMEAGQLISTGYRNLAYTGISLTNDPIEPRRLFEDFVIDGYTMAESDVEIFLNNRLIAHQRSYETGYYRFDVPISYGNTLYQVVIYTPTGETLEIDRRIQVPFNFLPKGEFSYRLSAGRVDDSILFEVEDKYFVQPELAYGVTGWMTFSGGMELLNTAGEFEEQLFASLSLRPFQNQVVSLDAVPDRFYRLNSNTVFANNASM